MAIFRPGGVVGEVSGKMGGTVFASGGGSRVVRMRAKRTGVPSAAAPAARQAVQRCQQVWRDSSEDTRRSWATAAATKQFPNRLGEGRKITGLQLFLKWALSVADGNPSVDSPPPTVGQMYVPSVFGAYFLEDGPYAVTCSRDGTLLGTLSERGFAQRGIGPAQQRGFRRLRRVYDVTRETATQDLYAEIAAGIGNLAEGERFAVGASWYVADGYMGARAEAAGTVGSVPWTVDGFERTYLGPYTGNGSNFGTSDAEVVDGGYSLLGSIASGPISTVRVSSKVGLPLYPLRGHQFQVWMRPDAGTRYGQVEFAWTDAANNYFLRWAPTINLQLYTIVANTPTLIASVSGSALAADTWGRAVVDWGQGGTMRIRAYTAGGSLVGSASGSNTDWDAGGLAFVVSNLASNATDVYFDSVEVLGASEV